MDSSLAAKLVDHLNSEDETVRHQAIESVYELDDASPFALVLTRMLVANEAEVEEQMNSSLESVRQPPAEQLPGFIDLLSHSMQDEAKTDQAYWSATFLGQIGGHSEEALDALKKASEFAVARVVRERAGRALKRLGQSRPEIGC